MTHPRGRRRRIVLLTLCALVLLGFTFRHSALVAVADFLDVGEAPVAADFAYVLGGDVMNRPAAAAALYHDGYVPRIVLTRVADTAGSAAGLYPNETELAEGILDRLGVPDSAVVVLQPPGGVGNTAAEGEVLGAYLQHVGAERVLVVTNDFHTRRARWNMRRKLGDSAVEITMIAVEKPYLSSQNWWQLEEGVILYFEEYLKFMHNFFYR